MKVSVIGAGAWGTALSILSFRSGNDVVLWSFDGAFAEFDGVNMPSEIKLTNNMGDLCDSDVWLIVTPSAYFRETLRKAKSFYKKQPIIICTKGLESGSNRFMSELLNDELPECTDYGVLSGPQFAHEVANNVPTGSTLAGNPAVLGAGRVALSELYLDERDDIIGAEICGCGKNALALISGFISVITAGENEKALIFTRAWGEVVNFGIANGAKIDSFLALCGLGDLFLSATSPTSRNYSGGVALAKGSAPLGTVEGIFALNGIINRADGQNIKTPILSKMQLQMGIK